MASKIKLTAITVAIIGLSGAIAFTLSTMKAPPEKKEEKDTSPIVTLTQNKLEHLTLNVDSYGLVNPKHHTMLTAQVAGQVTQLSERFVKGGFVKQGEVLARIDPNDYEAAMIEAEASHAQARAALEMERAEKRVRESEWERIKNSAKNEFIPTELYLRKPQLAEKLARFRAAEAGLKRAKRNLERTYIKAPYDALITARSISLGSVVNPGNALGELSATSVAEIRLPVADKDLRFLKHDGISATVSLTTEYQGSMKTWQGTVVRNEGVIDNKSRMSYLVAQIQDPYGLKSAKTPLRFGSYVNASIEGLALSNVSKVKSHLIKDGKIATFNSDNNTLEFFAVEIIQEQGEFAIVKGDLSEASQLITSNLKFPVEGMKLKKAGEEMPITPSADPITQLALKED